MSFSGGKDCTLALWRMRERGYRARALLTTYRLEGGRSWFHGLRPGVLTSVSEAMGIPCQLLPVGHGGQYRRDMLAALRELRAQGLSLCAFGDIDLQGHYEWCDALCREAGMQSCFPLWKESREKLVYEFMDLGFQAAITVVRRAQLSEDFLGRTLSRAVVAEITAAGADICGENGEYHTLVYDGPLFQKALTPCFENMFRVEQYSILPVRSMQTA